jgi:thiosulfate/3-mercaptopyruvate sulfurtransferase
MSKKIKKIMTPGSMLLIAALLGVIAVGSLAIWGCGSDGTSGYDPAVTTTKTATALIEPETLKQWMDEGKVNGDIGDRVVILQVATSAQYQTGHIPGAQLFDSSGLFQTRLEGLAAAAGMVLDGQRMDSIIQRCGIDNNTTIVFTASTTGSILYATREYFTFRYWGFPKERLKVLDGYDKAWDATYPGTLTTEAPVVTPSTYSVRNNPALAPDLRASLGEMISAVKAASANNVIIDCRGTDGQPGVGTKYSYDGDPGVTTGVFLPSGDYIAVEGRMKGSVALKYTDLLDSNNKFLPADQLIAKYASIGDDSSKTSYVFCRTGVIASLEFFVLDGILGWNVELYDGSWSQWGSMCGDSAEGGLLASYSVWRTDTPDLMDIITYNQDYGYTVEEIFLDPVSVESYQNTADLTANQIEEEDANYMAGAATGGTPAIAAPVDTAAGC